MDKIEATRKIAALREKYVASAESQTDIDQLEADLQKLFEESEVREHPVFKAIVADAETRLNDINALLMNDKNLSDEERKSLFGQKDVWNFIFERFSLVSHDRALEALNQLLDSRLAQ